MVLAHLQVEVSGGEQRHPDTHKIHTGISYIRARGTPVYNFAPAALPAALPAASGASTCSVNRENTSGRCNRTALPNSSSVVAVDTTPADQPQPAVLKYTKSDPLVQAGGLFNVSERGRLMKISLDRLDLESEMDNGYLSPYYDDYASDHYW